MMWRIHARSRPVKSGRKYCRIEGITYLLRRGSGSHKIWHLVALLADMGQTSKIDIPGDGIFVGSQFDSCG